MQEIHRDVGTVKTVIVHDLKILDILVYSYLPSTLDQVRLLDH